LLLAQSLAPQETLENVIHHFHGLMAQSQHEYSYLALFGEVVGLPEVEIMCDDDVPFPLGQGDNLLIAQSPGRSRHRL